MAPRDIPVASPGRLSHCFGVRVITSISAMQRLARQCIRSGRRIGFVPTMGCLHAGHLSLVHRARRAVGNTGRVIVSIYVNPTQFGPNEDFSRYPRDLKRDLKLCREAGVDIVFAPADRAMYPGKNEGRYSTYVVEEQLSRGMEGVSRPGHFRGVTTIVAKLFHLVQPDAAVFGAKDFQQAAVIRRMASDLNLPVKIIVAPTLREPDGLAMSSRNKYLTGARRAQATVLWQCIRETRAAVRKSPGPIPAARLKGQVTRRVKACPAARLEYVEFFEPDTLEPVSRVTRGARMALAVFVGGTRLIDNARL